MVDRERRAAQDSTHKTKYSPQQEPALNMSEQVNKQDHYRMWLNNFVKRHKLGQVSYSDELQQETWVSTVQLNETTIGEGQAGNKNNARENAARQALEHLQSQHSN